MTADDRPAGGFSKQGIRFPLLGIPVLVRWSHFVLDAVLLWPLFPLLASSPGAIVSVGPLFLMIPAAVLVHEVGHAAAGRVFGGRPRIELVLFGGLTYPHLPEGTGPGRRAVVSLAGPVAGIAAGAAVWSVTGSGLGELDVSGSAELFVWAAAVWGGLNLVPLPGLDGGHVLDSSAELLAGSRGVRAAAVVKAVTAVGVLAAVWAWVGLFGVLWIAIVLGRTGVDEVRRGWEAPRIEMLRGAIDLRRRGEFRQAAIAARSVMDATTDRGLREVARQLLVGAAAAADDWETVADHADSESESEAPGLVRALVALDRLPEAEAAARSIDGPDGRLLLAETLVLQDLPHLVEIEDRSSALALTHQAMTMEAQGRVEAGRALAREIARRPDVAADARARALLQLGQPLGPLVDDLTPSARWAADLETAGRGGNVEALRRLLRADVEEHAAAAVQIRLHLTGRYREAIHVGRRALESASPHTASTIAYNVACSLARTGRPGEARELLDDWFPEGLPDSALTDTDLASVREEGAAVPNPDEA